MNHLRDVRVLVLGLGESGLAMALWCLRCGASVRVWDSRIDGAGDASAVPNAALLRAAHPDVGMLAGTLDASALDGVSRVFKSPGLAPADGRISPLLAEASARGVPVEGELDLYARALTDLKAERDYAPQVLAITGTNGKTTTTALAALLVERAGRRVATAGNIGPTMLRTLADALDAEAADATGSSPLPEVWVLELSSFQLDGVSGFEPSAGALLNLTEDHLDWHGSMKDYGAAKARVWGACGVRVVNRDDLRVMSLAEVTPPPAATSDGSRGRRKPVHAAPPLTVSFGLDAPRRPGDYGLVVDHGMAWLVRAQPSDAPAGSKRRRVSSSARADADGRSDIHADTETQATASFDEDTRALVLQHLMPADALRVRGHHNAANALAALALATAIDCPLAPMLHGLRQYAGEPHRVEHVATVGGIDAFDDSKGTNVGATVAALNGLGADRAPARLVVILGGDGKGQDFMPLAEPVAAHARAVATLGRDAGAIEAALAGVTGLAMQRHPTLEAATRWAWSQAEAGDAVLLSPACASLDMFRNYAHRAAVFVAEVRAIAVDAGEAL
jgi:UDP-N-acetylmuramoylalanine--D-glutamate ligase